MNRNDAVIDFMALIEALEQYVQNTEEAIEGEEAPDPYLVAKCKAAERMRLRMEARLACLAQ